MRRRIRLAHAQAVRHDEQAETQAYLREASSHRSDFGLSLGEVLRQRTRE